MLNPRKLSWTILILLALCIKIFAVFPELVERYYAHGIYQYISTAQRAVLGWIPFSMGDILYFICGLYLVRKAVLFFRAAMLKRLTLLSLIQSAKRLVYFCLLVYVVFNSLWGLNYNRLPMIEQMDMPLQPYSSELLETVLVKLVNQVNNNDSLARLNREALKRKRTLFIKSVESYAVTGVEKPFLQYRVPSVKPSLYSYLGNYLGFTGYYNPFSGEAQVNTTVPVFVLPFTTCHEIGHQLGYAKENEANFAGFLAARTSMDPAFRYSAYFDMYSYAIRELALRDSISAKLFQTRLRPAVRQDIKTIREFYKRFETPLEVLISTLYGHYLKANEQPEGIRSYNEVVAMLVAFYVKYGYV
jgi:hypothetical protein